GFFQYYVTVVGVSGDNSSCRIKIYRKSVSFYTQYTFSVFRYNVSFGGFLYGKAPRLQYKLVISNFEPGRYKRFLLFQVHRKIQKIFFSGGKIVCNRNGDFFFFLWLKIKIIKAPFFYNKPVFQ